MTNNTKKLCKHGKKFLKPANKKKLNLESTPKRLISSLILTLRQKVFSMNSFKSTKSKKCCENKDSMKEVKFVNQIVIL